MKRIRNIIAIGFSFLPIAFIFTRKAFGEDVLWHVNNAAILSNSSIIEDGVRWLMWAITRFACFLSNGAEGLYDKTFGMIDITKYPDVDALIQSLEPVLVALMVLCLIGLGITYMFLREKRNLVRNILLAGLVLAGSTYLFTTANELVTFFKGGVLGEEGEYSSYEIVNNNLIDLVGLDSAENIEDVNYQAGTGILHNAGVADQESFSSINLREVLNYSDKKKGQDLYGWSDTFNTYLSYRAVKIHDSYTSIKVYNGLLASDIGNNFYYRYSFDFWSCILELCALILIYLALSYKNVRIAYELIVSRFFAFLYAADIGNGERLKAILFFIRDTYIALCVSILSLKLFFILSAMVTSFGITGIGKGLVIIFIAYAVIDGPNIAERILGIDAGLSSSVGRTLAIFGVVRAGGRVAARGVRTGWRRVAETRRNKPYGRETSEKENTEEKKKREERPEGEKGKGTYREETSQTQKMESREESAGEGRKPVGEKEKESYRDPTFMRDEADREETVRNQKMEEKPNPNPAFRKAVQDFTPDKKASKGEKRDYHRQVDAIVKGDHKAIPPDPKSKAPYKERNYRKALELERIYHKKKGKSYEGK